MDATERDMNPQKKQLLTPNSRGDMSILVTPAKTVGFDFEPKQNKKIPSYFNLNLVENPHF